jgi:hypothetical protein
LRNWSTVLSRPTHLSRRRGARLGGRVLGIGLGIGGNDHAEHDCVYNGADANADDRARNNFDDDSSPLG